MNDADIPAAPRLLTYYSNNLGLTKREYLAAMAMQGLSSDPKFMFDCCPIGTIPAEFIAAQAVAVADALLKELEE